MPRLPLHLCALSLLALLGAPRPAAADDPAPKKHSVESVPPAEQLTRVAQWPADRPDKLLGRVERRIVRCMRGERQWGKLVFARLPADASQQPTVESDHAKLGQCVRRVLGKARRPASDTLVMWRFKSRRWKDDSPPMLGALTAATPWPPVNVAVDAIDDARLADWLHERKRAIEPCFARTSAGRVDSIAAFTVGPGGEIAPQRFEGPLLQSDERRQCIREALTGAPAPAGGRIAGVRVFVSAMIIE